MLKSSKRPHSIYPSYGVNLWKSSRQMMKSTHQQIWFPHPSYDAKLRLSVAVKRNVVFTEMPDEVFNNIVWCRWGCSASRTWNSHWPFVICSIWPTLAKAAIYRHLLTVWRTPYKIIITAIGPCVACVDDTFVIYHRNKKCLCCWTQIKILWSGYIPLFRRSGLKWDKSTCWRI